MKGRKKWRLWVTLRFIGKQRLRTAAILCGMLFSSFLLTAFGSLGYDFWRQVHGEAGEGAEFDSTRKILILLILILLLLVTSCAGILLRNLFSLTFPQRRRSLERLISIGADFRDIAKLEVLEILILYIAAVPGGCMLAVGLSGRMGIRTPTPLWIPGGVMLWILLVSCVRGVRPPEEKKGFKKRKASKKHSRPRLGFLWYAAGKYRRAHRERYLRITVSVMAAILLYVPAGYLIDTNIAGQRSGLNARYGIRYDCSPENREELEAALQEYRRLADWDKGDSMVCVSLNTRADIRTDVISRELRKALREAGWEEETAGGISVLTVDANLLFVEDAVFAECQKAVKEKEDEEEAITAILLNRYTNRSRWSEEGDVFFRETSVLAREEEVTGVKVYYDFSQEDQPDTGKFLFPEGVIQEMPEGIDFTGSLCLILPLERMDSLCPSKIRQGMFQVYGKFEDGDFDSLKECLGDNPAGRLSNTRRMLLEWFRSMEGIHRAMNAISLTLFFMAALNIFSMMIFQYMERKKGLAILWSAGLSSGSLFRLMIMENITHFLMGILAGVPLSVFLCYYIYGVFRQTWQITFALPVRQLLLITIAVPAVSAAAFLLDGILLRRQNFLAHIKEIT